MNEKPLKLPYTFEEALGRLARVPKEEIDQKIKKPGVVKPRASRLKPRSR